MATIEVPVSDDSQFREEVWSRGSPDHWTSSELQTGFTVPAGDKKDEDKCALCEAKPLTKRIYEDEWCWVAPCTQCKVPMVVWREHTTDLTSEQVGEAVAHLFRAATFRWGDEGFTIDFERKSIPDHWHAHARPKTYRGIKAGDKYFVQKPGGRVLDVPCTRFPDDIVRELNYFYMGESLSP